MTDNVSVIIPAFNEEERITQTVESAWSIPGVGQVIVVDDGSQDRTAQMASRVGATVVRSKRNLGKGDALSLGLQKATGDFVLLLDADLGRSATEAKKILEPVMRGQADMTIARFTGKKKGGGFGLVLTLARRAVRMLTGLSIEAPLSGQRALNRRAVSALGGIGASGFGAEVAMIIDLAKEGMIIKEVPVEMEHRETGRDLAGFLHRGRQFWQTMVTVVRRMF